MVLYPEWLRHADARIRARQPLPLMGYIREAMPMAGEGGAATDAADGDPEFVISSEGEATDHNIVRQFWDLSRANTVGVPVLIGHDSDGMPYGQWHSIATRGTLTTARCGLDREDPIAQMARGKIARNVIRGCSVRWIPGATIRRGELDPSDPLYREPVDGMCGPEEGYVMGAYDDPNTLVECSLVSCAADPSAAATGRMHARGLALAERHGLPASDLDALLAAVAGNASAQRWLRGVIREELRALSNLTPSAHARGLNDLFDPS